MISSDAIHPAFKPPSADHLGEVMNKQVKEMNAAIKEAVENREEGWELLDQVQMCSVTWSDGNRSLAGSGCWGSHCSDLFAEMAVTEERSDRGLPSAPRSKFHVCHTMAFKGNKALNSQATGDANKDDKRVLMKARDFQILTTDPDGSNKTYRSLSDVLKNLPKAFTEEGLDPKSNIATENVAVGIRVAYVQLAPESTLGSKYSTEITYSKRNYNTLLASDPKGVMLYCDAQNASLHLERPTTYGVPLQKLHTKIKASPMEPWMDYTTKLTATSRDIENMGEQSEQADEEEAEAAALGLASRAHVGPLCDGWVETAACAWSITVPLEDNETVMRRKREEEFARQRKEAEARAAAERERQRKAAEERVKQEAAYNVGDKRSAIGMTREDVEALSQAGFEVVDDDMEDDEDRSKYRSASADDDENDDGSLKKGAKYRGLSASVEGAADLCVDGMCRSMARSTKMPMKTAVAKETRISRGDVVGKSPELAKKELYSTGQPAIADLMLVFGIPYNTCPDVKSLLEGAKWIDRLLKATATLSDDPNAIIESRLSDHAVAAGLSSAAPLSDKSISEISKTTGIPAHQFESFKTYTVAPKNCEVGARAVQAL